MQIRLELLGHFQVIVDGRAVSAGDWRRARSVALVKLLALAPAYRLHREQVMEALWPELAPDAAAANLRKAVHYARRALNAHDATKLAGETLVLAPDAEIAIDAVLFEVDARAALRAHDRSEEHTSELQS